MNSRVKVPAWIMLCRLLSYLGSASFTVRAAVPGSRLRTGEIFLQRLTLASLPRVFGWVASGSDAGAASAEAVACAGGLTRVAEGRW